MNHRYGGGADEDAAVADLDAAAQVERAEPGLLPLLGHREVLALGEDGPLVARAVAVGVFEDHDAVARHLALRRALRVLEALDDPDAALLVDGEGDRVDDLRLAGEELDLELVGDLELRDRLLRREVRLAGRLAVVEAELLLGERRTTRR